MMHACTQVVCKFAHQYRSFTIHLIHKIDRNLFTTACVRPYLWLLVATARTMRTTGAWSRGAKQPLNWQPFRYFPALALQPPAARHGPTGASSGRARAEPLSCADWLGFLLLIELFLGNAN